MIRKIFWHHIFS